VVHEPGDLGLETTQHFQQPDVVVLTHVRSLSQDRINKHIPSIRAPRAGHRGAARLRPNSGA
jgi:hypothetical protein